MDWETKTNCKIQSVAGIEPGLIWVIRDGKTEYFLHNVRLPRCSSHCIWLIVCDQLTNSSVQNISGKIHTDKVLCESVCDVSVYSSL